MLSTGTRLLFLAFFKRVGSCYGQILSIPAKWQRSHWSGECIPHGNSFLVLAIPNTNATISTTSSKCTMTIELMSASSNHIFIYISLYIYYWLDLHGMECKCIHWINNIYAIVCRTMTFKRIFTCLRSGRWVKELHRHTSFNGTW
jgi:hypothetical protein